MDLNGIQDLSNCDILARSSANPLMASNSFSDTESTQLLQFQIAIDSSNLTLIFSEMVNVVNTLNASELVIQVAASSNPSRSVRLTGGHNPAFHEQCMS